MNNKRRIIYLPSYLLNFKCTQDKCPDNCCIGWRVAIDKKTYKKYNKVTTKNFKEKFKEYIKRNKIDPSDRKYAFINLKKDSSCPFLSQDKLCSIHSNLGYNHLTTICDVYPRITNIIDDRFERVGTMSCPEVAQLALLNEKKMELVKSSESEDTRYSLYNIVNTKISDTYEKYFYVIRDFSIELIQNRNYKLWERVLILGMAIDEINKEISSEKFYNIINIINYYKNLTSSYKELDVEFTVDSKTQTNIQVKILKYLIDEKVKNGIKNKRYYQCLNEFLEGINYSSDSKLEDLSNNYREAYNKYFQPFIKDKEYILENYLVNYIYKTTFPLGKTKNIFDEFILLNLHYSLIKMHLIGMAGYYKEAFNEDLVIKLIQSFTKIVSHNINYLDFLLKYLHNSKQATLTYMAVLIIN